MPLLLMKTHGSYPWLLPWLGLRAAAYSLLSAIEPIEEPRLPFIIAAALS
jgi:hypothetical protein